MGREPVGLGDLIQGDCVASPPVRLRSVPQCRHELLSGVEGADTGGLYTTKGGTMNDVEFWMVMRENGTAPTKRHDTLAAAEEEARRLAQQHPAARFYVLQAVTLVAVEAQPVKMWKLFGNPAGLR